MLNKFNRSKGPRRGQISSGGPARGGKVLATPFKFSTWGWGFAGGGKMKTKGHAGGGKMKTKATLAAAKFA